MDLDTKTLHNMSFPLDFYPLDGSVQGVTQLTVRHDGWVYCQGWKNTTCGENGTPQQDWQVSQINTF